MNDKIQNDEKQAEVVVEEKTPFQNFLHTLLDLPSIITNGIVTGARTIGSATMTATRVAVFGIILGVVFYMGMYVQATMDGRTMTDSYAQLKAEVAHAMRDTSQQPVLVIVPEHSWFEKAKASVGYELPKRERKVITTAAITANLGIELPQKPGSVQTALKFWNESASNSWGWWTQKVNFMD